MKIKIWLDSGANIKSVKEFTVEMDDKDWENMSEDEKDKFVWEEVYQRIEYGYEEV